MKKRYFQTAAIMVLLFANVINAQDVHYSQPLVNPLSLNPALMNLNDDLRINLDYRSQWQSLNGGGYTTSSFTGMYPLFLNGRDEKLDFGINAIMDKAGAFNNLNFTLAIGYGLKISESSYLSASVSGGYFQKTLDVGSLTFDDQYVLGSYSSTTVTGETVLNQKASYPDVNFGVLWSIRPEDAKLNSYFGISGFHLTQPKETYTNQTGILPRKFSFQSGLKFIGDNKLDFTPNIFITSQSGAEEISAGLYLDYHLSDLFTLTIGGWYRQRDAFACVFKIEVDKFILGYSYDIPNSEIGRAIGGLNVHEISLSFKMNRNDEESHSLI